MSDLSSARFCVDDAQIRRRIAPALEAIGLHRFLGRNEAARKAAFEKFLTDTLIPIVMQINCYEDEDPKRVAQALKVFLECNFVRATNIDSLRRERHLSVLMWCFQAVGLIFFNQVGLSIFAASMVLLHISVDQFSKSISREVSLCSRLYKYRFPALIGLGVGFLALGYLQGSIESTLCSAKIPDENEPVDDPGFDSVAWCREQHPDWLRNQVYATDAGLAIVAVCFCFYLLSGNCKFNRWVHHTSDREVSRFLTEFSGATSFQGYLNQVQKEYFESPGALSERFNQGILKCKLDIIKAILKAICENLDPQIFQVVPVVPQNPLSINAGQVGFGAEELSRGLLREPNNANANANANARRSALVLNPLTSGSPSLSADGLLTPNYQLSEG